MTEYKHKPKVGDQLYVVTPSGRRDTPARTDVVTVTKVGSKLVTLQSVEHEWRTWTMRIVGQQQDSKYSGAPYYRTAGQIKHSQMVRAARNFLDTHGIMIKSGSTFNSDDALIKLAFHVADLIDPMPTDN